MSHLRSGREPRRHNSDRAERRSLFGAARRSAASPNLRGRNRRVEYRPGL
ncbi:MAG: hypothetical protein AB7V26_01325 [Lysobacterales bacterium]